MDSPELSLFEVLLVFVCCCLSLAFLEDLVVVGTVILFVPLLILSTIIASFFELLENLVKPAFCSN